MTTQLFVKELKCSFNLRTPRSDKPSIIYLVTRLHGRQYKFSTGMKVYPTQWERESQRAVTSGSTLTRLDCTNNSLANNRIEEFRQRFEEFKRHLLDSPDSETDLPERLKNFMQTGAAEVSDSELLHEAFCFLYPPDSTTAGTLRTNRSRLKRIDKYLTTAPLQARPKTSRQILRLSDATRSGRQADKRMLRTTEKAYKHGCPLSSGRKRDGQ